MADIDSGLPIRTQLPGQAVYEDVVTKLGDGTTSTQLAKVDTFGSQQTTIADVAGNLITSEANGGLRALDVMTQTSGPVAPGTAANFSDLIGGQYNATLPTLTDTQQSAVQLDSRGRLLVSAILPYDENYGVVGATTLRTAAQIGNATGAADFNNGATGAQTLRVAANLAVGGANVSPTNPVPVTLSDAPLGTPVNDYKQAPAIAVNASDNHDYPVTAAKTFQGKKFWASASGLMKAEFQTSPDGLVFTTLWVGFNSTATPNITIDMNEMVFLAAGVGAIVRVICTNLDKKAQDLYSTISGTEV